MPLESSTTIAGLDDSWPLNSDQVLEGDNHIRLLKAVLKAQFPGVGGEGFATPITATEAEINYLVGLTGNVQGQIDDIVADVNLYAPAGTVLVFYQASPPVGWTQLTDNDNSMLRVVSGGSGGAYGGTDSPISASFNHTHTTGSFTLAVDHIPAHTHNFSFSSSDTDTSGGGARLTNILGDHSLGYDRTVGSTGGGLPHNHGTTGSATLSWAPKYINVITAIKD